MFGGGFFFFDQVVDHARHAATAEALRDLVLGFALWVAHETPIKGLFRADVVIIVKGQFAALAAL
jgi:hypothetical protein